MRVGLKLAVLAAGALVAGGAGAAGVARLPRLPPDYVFPQGEGSPGKVTFSHAAHVDAAQPRCTTCHPRSFRILQSGRDFTGEPLRHQRMEAGAACGECHGKTAFGFDACDNCHRG